MKDVLQRLMELDGQDGYGGGPSRASEANLASESDWAITDIDPAYPLTIPVLIDCTESVLALLEVNRLVVSPWRTVELVVRVALVVVGQSEQTETSGTTYPPLSDEVIGGHFKRCAIAVGQHPSTPPMDSSIPAGVFLGAAPRVLRMIAQDHLVLTSQQEAQLVMAVVWDCYMEMQNG